MPTRRRFLRQLSLGALGGLAAVPSQAKTPDRMPTESYEKNDRLPVIRPGWPGNKLVGRQFVNADGTVFVSEFSKLLKWQFQRNPQREEKKADTWTPEVRPLTADLLTGSGVRPDTLTWLGHATFLVQWAGKRVLTDPVFFNVSVVKRRHPLPFPDQNPARLTNLDVVFISHGHRDHLDERSVKLVHQANPNAQWLVPLRLGRFLTDWGVPTAQVQEAGWWQSFDLPGTDFPLELTCLPAQHWHRRGLTDMNVALWSSLLIRPRATDRTLWFAGDTAWGPHFAEIAELIGPVDWALLPIGAYKPPFMMRAAHMNPQEAVKAFNTLRAETLVPMHHGTFDLSDEPASEPVRVTEQLARSGGLSAGQRLLTPAVGEPVPLS